MNTYSKESQEATCSSAYKGYRPPPKWKACKSINLNAENVKWIETHYSFKAVSDLGIVADNVRQLLRKAPNKETAACVALNIAEGGLAKRDSIIRALCKELMNYWDRANQEKNEDYQSVYSYGYQSQFKDFAPKITKKKPNSFDITMKHLDTMHTDSAEIADVRNNIKSCIDSLERVSRELSSFHDPNLSNAKTTVDTVTCCLRTQCDTLRAIYNVNNRFITDTKHFLSVIVSERNEFQKRAKAPTIDILDHLYDTEDTFDFNLTLGKLRGMFDCSGLFNDLPQELRNSVWEKIERTSYNVGMIDACLMPDYQLVLKDQYGNYVHSDNEHEFTSAFNNEYGVVAIEYDLSKTIQDEKMMKDVMFSNNTYLVIDSLDEYMRGVTYTDNVITDLNESALQKLLEISNDALVTDMVTLFGEDAMIGISKYVSTTSKFCFGVFQLLIAMAKNKEKAKEILGVDNPFRDIDGILSALNRASSKIITESVIRSRVVPYVQFIRLVSRTNFDCTSTALDCLIKLIMFCVYSLDFSFRLEDLGMGFTSDDLKSKMCSYDSCGKILDHYVSKDDIKAFDRCMSVVNNIYINTVNVNQINVNNSNVGMNNVNTNSVTFKDGNVNVGQMVNNVNCLSVMYSGEQNRRAVEDSIRKIISEYPNARLMLVDDNKLAGEYQIERLK